MSENTLPRLNTHLKEFAETDNYRAVVLLVVGIVGVPLFRFVRTDVVYDGAQFQDFAANVRLCFSSSQIRFGSRNGPTSTYGFV